MLIKKCALTVAPGSLKYSAFRHISFFVLLLSTLTINSKFCLADTVADKMSSYVSIKSSDIPNTSDKTISIEDLLDSFVKNGARQLFEGVFVYLTDDQVQTFRVNRTLTEQGKIVERFLAQDDAREMSERVLENQFCSLVNGWQYQFQAISSSFPFRVNNYFHDLQHHYDFSLSNFKVVAGKPAVQMNIKAKDSYRYGYQLWFEPETAILLKYKLVDQQGDAVEQYFFTDIKLASETLPEQFNTEKDVACEKKFSGLKQALNRFIQPKNLPGAYTPISYRKGMIHHSQRQAHQFLFSDGLSTVSVFIEDQNENNKPINGIVKLGPMSVAGKNIGSYQVTVLGAIPVEGALKFLESVRY